MLTSKWHDFMGNAGPDLRLPPTTLIMLIMLDSTTTACPISKTEKRDVDQTCTKGMKGMVYAVLVTLIFFPMFYKVIELRATLTKRLWGLYIKARGIIEDISQFWRAKKSSS